MAQEIKDGEPTGIFYYVSDESPGNVAEVDYCDGLNFSLERLSPNAIRAMVGIIDTVFEENYLQKNVNKG